MGIDEILKELEGNLKAGNLSRRTFALIQAATTRAQALREEKFRGNFLEKIEELSKNMGLINYTVTAYATNNLRQELNQILTSLEKMIALANNAPCYYWLGAKLEKLRAEMNIMSMRIMFGDSLEELGQNEPRHHLRVKWRAKR